MLRYGTSELLGLNSTMGGGVKDDGGSQHHELAELLYMPSPLPGISYHGQEAYGERHGRRSQEGVGLCINPRRFRSRPCQLQRSSGH